MPSFIKTIRVPHAKVWEVVADFGRSPGLPSKSYSPSRMIRKKRHRRRAPDHF